MHKPLLHLQPNLFWEDEQPDTRNIIERHFEVVEVGPQHLLSDEKPANFRGSLNLARKFKLDYGFTNCQKWYPYFRPYTLCPSDSYFNELRYFVDYNKEYPLYLRPADGYKTFSGQVFPNKDRLLEEYNYLTNNLNIGPELMCLTMPVRKIDREWRTVFINNQYVDGCLYMKGQDYVEPESGCPKDVEYLAKHIGHSDYFINKFNYVIDICESNGRLHLLEINSFNSSSFYIKLDLKKRWSASARIQHLDSTQYEDPWQAYRKRIRSFGKLEANWDSFGTPAIGEKAIAATLAVIEAAAQSSTCSVAWAKPTSDESILMQELVLLKGKLSAQAERKKTLEAYRDWLEGTHRARCGRSHPPAHSTRIPPA